ncbi:hypothetical protein SlsnVgp086 [Spodoptera littoralis nucleopolyhedrovirus]|uniref:P40 n=1 Tax=Spodoptera littoralis nuclear polyhedrosis virus TaxID=10456 RepID=M1K3X2_NPVSL|nr:hypothetical protein SlsnVgp086 [Spodoptera littoralis nucleopolyhedrovirus]AGE89941.1 hypothetical protein SlsnVgp086 [Spodoptera littoralis nucleopolyhedrovirus]
MSSVMLFLEIENIKNKIDKRMNMGIWPKFFPLLADPQASIQLSLDEINDFLVTTARISEIDRSENNAALTSQFVSTATAPTAVDATSSDSAAPRSQGIFNIFKTAAASRNVIAGAGTINVTPFQRRCQKILQYYTSVGTTSAEFKISDLMACMVFLANTAKYRTLFELLRTSMSDDYECMPPMSERQIQENVDALRDLTGLTAYSVDYESLRMMKTSLGKVMNYPIARYPRIIIAETYRTSHDQQCNLEDLIVERYENMKRLEPQCATESNAKIPHCNDTELVDHLVKIIDDFSVERMFYNAANSIFYSTMENYATSNCRFVPDDYNNIFKSMDHIRDPHKNSLFRSDTLNVSLGSSSSTSKRKKYI